MLYDATAVVIRMLAFSLINILITNRLMYYWAIVGNPARLLPSWMFVTVVSYGLDHHGIYVELNGSIKGVDYTLSLDTEEFQYYS
jgi:hypothetical protein